MAFPGQTEMAVEVAAALVDRSPWPLSLAALLGRRREYHLLPFWAVCAASTWSCARRAVRKPATPGRGQPALADGRRWSLATNLLGGGGRREPSSDRGPAREIVQ